MTVAYYTFLSYIPYVHSLLHLDVSLDLRFLHNTFGRNFLEVVVIVVYAVVYKLFVTFWPVIVIIDFVVHLAQARIVPRAIVSHHVSATQRFTQRVTAAFHCSVSPINWRVTWLRLKGR